ncbi:hypothetical protein PTNB85_00516 [Pyrenophora teres f. teres]|nr:hypothetical protein HRS9139_02142 [Pyrenophora teres f. teres]KAE8850100.1 hypothetical protein PTNB85_00516 [Pyrenophora teres f. teres]KAE8870543.1 hypothetical protein PTNB29_00887 [Pyrenophora teres f. teres]
MQLTNLLSAAVLLASTASATTFENFRDVSCRAWNTSFVEVTKAELQRITKDGYATAAYTRSYSPDSFYIRSKENCPPNSENNYKLIDVPQWAEGYPKKPKQAAWLTAIYYKETDTYRFCSAMGSVQPNGYAVLHGVLPPPFTPVLIPSNTYPFSSFQLIASTPPTNDPSPLNSALANTIPPSNTLQPYTAPFLAHLSMFVLRAPVFTMKYALSPGDSASDASFTSLCESLDPNSDALRPNASVNVLYQCLIRILKEIPRKFCGNDPPSSDTIPLALCLLARYRMALAPVPSDCDDIVMSEAPEREVRSPSCVSEVPSPVFTAVSAAVPGALSDVTLITMCVYIVYHYLAAGHICVDLRQWSRPLEIDAAKLLVAESVILAAID